MTWDMRSNLTGLIIKFIFFIFQTFRYLQGTPCSQQSVEIIHSFLKALEPFKLTKAEKVMLLNNPPTTPLEIQLVCIHLPN